MIILNQSDSHQDLCATETVCLNVAFPIVMQSLSYDIRILCNVVFHVVTTDSDIVTITRSSPVFVNKGG